MSGSNSSTVTQWVTPRNATVIVVGSGPAGLGSAALLRKCGIDVIVLEKGEVAQTFKSWPKETRFISPSFTGNFFGCPDLNAITPESSPAFTLQSQHPTGEGYAKYLNNVKEHMDIDVATGTEVIDIVVEKLEVEQQSKSKVDSCGMYNSMLDEYTNGKKTASKETDGEGSDAAEPSVSDVDMPSADVALQEELCDAIANGKIALVRELLGERGADATKPGTDPVRLPMYFAAKAGEMDIVSLLLEHGADVHMAKTDDGATSLFMAAQMGHVEVAALLLTHKVDPNQSTTDDGQTPLFIACQEGHLDVVTMLLREGADVTKATLDEGRTPLWVAAASDHADVVVTLLRHGANVNDVTTDIASTPLFVAAAFGNESVIEQLLKHKDIDPNLATSDAGATPLYIAAEGGFDKVVDALLTHSKTDVNKALQSDGCTPLFVASAMDHEEVVASLLKHNSTDANKPNNNKSTPLAVAAQEGYTKIVELLLFFAGRVNLDTKDIEGLTPIDLAEEGGYENIVNLLNDMKEGGEAAKSYSQRFMARLKARGKDLPDITIKTSKGDYTSKFLIWAGGEFQFPNRIPNTIRVGHGTGYESYADVPRGNHVVIGGGESGIDITHFLVGLGDTVTILDASAPWESHESDSSLGLSPYTFDRLRALRASGKVTLIAERADTITATEVRTKTHTIKLTNPAIDATGYDITKSLAGDLFSFDEGIPELTDYDESTVSKNVFLVGPHVQHGGVIFCFVYKYRQRFAVIVKQIMERLGTTKGESVIEEYARKHFLLEDLSECGDDCAC